MALVRHAVDGSPAGASSSIVVTKTGALQLNVSAGNWIEPDANGDPVTYTLAAEVLDFTADPTLPKDVVVDLVHNPAATPPTDLQVCAILVDTALIKDCSFAHAAPPAGYTRLARLAWFSLPAAATDLDATTVHWTQTE